MTQHANGNLTRDETGRQFLYDAWNRLVVGKDASGATLKSYAYDGLHRRISETASGTTTDLYYSDAWQVLEERVASGGTFCQDRHRHGGSPDDRVRAKCSRSVAYARPIE
ncbi:MAG: hypothetical protein KatS3mg109_0562 [Pirellulaceae bacterium]|nr:MAG: hypothetical protein KatS3mg109_0562 [Pirellulaceae bacterium]